MLLPQAATLSMTNFYPAAGESDGIYELVDSGLGLN